MFKLDDNEDTIIKNWPVIISKPQDGGKVQTHEINVDYLMLPQDELSELIESSKENNGYTDIDICRRVVKGINGIADEQGKGIEYSPELLERLIQRPYIRTALVSTYFDAVAGRKAKRKN